MFGAQTCIEHVTKKTKITVENQPHGDFWENQSWQTLQYMADCVDCIKSVVTAYAAGHKASKAPK